MEKMKSLLQADETKCFLCGKKGTLDTHHICNGGGLREKSDVYGGTIKLCRECHREVHEKYGLRELLKSRYQYLFEEEYGHEMWQKLFRKNYL